MQGKTHALFSEALVITLTVCSLTVPINTMTIYPGISILSAGFGAILPDIDMAQSQIGHKYPLVSKFTTHRGITHTLLIEIGLTTLFLAMSRAKDNGITRIAQSLMFGFILGYMSHLIADLCNGKGIPLFWPICTKKIYIMRVKTGKASELVFLVVTVLLMLLHIVTRY